MNYRRSKQLSLAVRSAIRFAGAAGALAGLGVTTAGQAQDTLDEEIVVTGVRGSLQESIQTKRESITVVDAITAEDVGKFPDKNLAEALQRVPGVVVNREYGEGERVNVRGTAANLTLTQLNGHALATADWFILDQLNTTRSFNYLMLPADIIGQVVVHKSPQADFEEGGIGATINVITRNPLDLEPFTFSASAQGAYSERSDDTDPNVSALFSWKNDQETFGILGAGVYQQRNIRRDGVEVLGYTDADPSAATLLAPSLIGSALFQQERIRTGGNLGIQFRPSDQLEFNLTALYSQFEADNLNENFLAWGVRALNDGGTLTNATVVGDTAVAGTISSPDGGTTGFGVVYDAIDRFATAETRSIDLDTNVDLSDEWSLHFRLGYTDAEGNTDAQPFVEFGAPASFDYDLRGRAPQVSFNNVDPTDPDDVSFIFSSLHEILNDDSETYIYADAERSMDYKALKALQFGVKHSDHDRELNFNATTYGGFHVPINTLPASTFAGGLTPSDFLENIASAGTLASYWEVNRDTVQQILFDNLANTTRVPYPQQNFSVNEKSYAGYVMGDLEGSGWRANVGVRVVRTEQTTSGNLVNPGTGSVPSAFGDFDPITVERSYTEVLPSFNYAYDVTDDIVLRFAAARVMTRPDFTDIAPRVSLNPGALSGTSGNPEVDPYRANQADISVEWYPTDESLLALAVYYKDIESFITDDPIMQIFPVQTSTPSAVCTPTGTPDLFNCPFTINQRANGGGGQLQGYELALTRPLWGGFGVQANYTFADSETDSGDPLPGNSRDQVNLTGYFENALLSARLSYTYRSEFFVTFDRTTQLNQDSLESLDASVLVNVLDNVALTFDGINLTNDKIVQFATEKFRPRAIYDNGRVYYAGVRVKF